MTEWLCGCGTVNGVNLPACAVCKRERSEGQIMQKSAPEPLRQREGDQALPIKNDLPFMHDLVKEDMEGRKQLGIKRYGTPLQPHNGRDALRDAYEEILDHAAYLRQMLYERDGK